MKFFGKIVSIILDVIMVLFSLLNIITGDSNFLDYFIVIGQLLLVVPGSVYYYYRKSKTNEQLNK